MSDLVHRGMDYSERVDNPREAAFAAVWEEENTPRLGVNFGMGILQDLMVETSKAYSRFGRRFRYVITQRDAEIVATVVQWLGSNVGMGFLATVLHQCGYCLVPKERLDELLGRESQQLKKLCGALRRMRFGEDDTRE